jgi:DnaK suppressor protein
MQERKLSETQEATVRQRLVNRLHAARGEMEQAAEVLRSKADDLWEIDEPIGSGTEREMALARQGILEVRIDELKDALERLDDGTYGICQECGEPIPWERLQIIPETRHCVQCESAIKEEK